MERSDRGCFLKDILFYSSRRGRWLVCGGGHANGKKRLQQKKHCYASTRYQVIVSVRHYLWLSNTWPLQVRVQKITHIFSTFPDHATRAQHRPRQGRASNKKGSFCRNSCRWEVVSTAAGEMRLAVISGTCTRSYDPIALPAAEEAV